MRARPPSSVITAAISSVDAATTLRLIRSTIAQRQTGGHVAAVRSGRIRPRGGRAGQHGQIIAQVGSVGNSTETHLHFEIRASANVYGDDVDSSPYLPPGCANG